MATSPVRRTIILRDVAAIVAITAVGTLFYRLPQFALSIDEAYVAPEFASMRSSWDWLLHLLSFSQNRLTFVGDYLLFRPGLFFVLWLEDFWRDQRTIVNAASVVIYCLAVASVYLVTTRITGRRLVSLALCTLLLFPSRATDFPNVTHITPYLLGVAFYLLGYYALAVQPPRLVLSTVLLFTATLFHEFVVAALLAGTAVFAIAAAAGVPTARRHVAVTGVPILTYALLYAVNWLLTSPVPLLAAREVMTRSPGDVARGASVIIANVAKVILPWPVLDRAPLDVGPLILLNLLVMGIVGYGVLSIYRTRAEPLVVGLASATGAILVGVIGTRLAARGLPGVSDRYQLMAACFVIPMAAVAGSSIVARSRLNARIVVATVMALVVGSAVSRAAAIADEQARKHAAIADTLAVSASLGQFYRSDESLCHAGLDVRSDATSGPEHRLELPALATMLQRFACGRRGGVPLYPVLLGDGQVQGMQWIVDTAPRRPVTIDPTSTRLGSAPVPQPPRFDPSFRITGRPNPPTTSASPPPRADYTTLGSLRAPLPGLQIQWSPGRRYEHPYYNFRVSWDSGSVDLRGTWAIGSGARNWSTWVPGVFETSELLFLRDAEDCVVLLNRHLLGRVAPCPDAAIDIEVAAWSLGEPTPVGEISATTGPGRVDRINGAATIP